MELETSDWHGGCLYVRHQKVPMSDWSGHARTRCAQRSIADEHIEIVMTWGADMRQRDGRVAYHLAVREASRARAEGFEVPGSAVGVAIVVADDGTIVTAVRSHDRQRLRAHGWHSSRRSASGGRR